MWSKASFNRTQRPSIGNPTLVDKTWDDSKYPSLSGGPQAQNLTKDLPALPNEADPSLQPQPEGNVNKRYSDVSPVESPVLGHEARDSESSFCVSPIHESEEWSHPRDDSRPSPPPTPVPPEPADPPPSQEEPPLPPPPPRPVKQLRFSPTPEQPTRWDDFSGEPTTKNTGKAGQVTPRDTTFHKAPSSHASNLFNWGREQLQPKKKLAEARSRITSFSKNEAPAPKEPRSRSSSRVRPLNEHLGNAQANTEDATAQITQINNLGFVPTVVTSISAGDSKPLPARPTTEDSPIPRDQTDPNFDTAIANMMVPNEPVSRFSTTTYTATDAGSQNNSRRTSVNLKRQSTEDLNSVIARRRPIPNLMPTSKKPVRKPTPTQAVQGPAPPPQPPANDPRRTHTGALRDELTRRRYNLETVIHELTQVIQPSSIAYDLAAKAEVKKTVNSIENELAEIKREEHELGLKITRAWRRLDEKENNGDGSGLWVKRVTS
ncbi:hypothetical protein NUU61_004857 [Penicillium alfredii]|uniref:BHLH domain-containing protein n=1 Tax=Penicillium alfredii TaxID=1506179 RepID=A0A9W9F8I6_9EURO|nr:uncharacterized protein NUU61_004857 [Penicillium alfredii]KAJ5095501.1 hypothetical protein NUU61_004857 [Penicillium alfredii]